MITNKTAIERHNEDHESHSDIRTLISTEASDRELAVTAEASARELAVSTEASARETAISDEVTARNTAIAAETTAREDADSAETLARQTGDNGLDEIKVNKIVIPAQISQDILSVPRMAGYVHAGPAVLPVNIAVGITFNANDWVQFSYIKSDGSAMLYTIKWYQNPTPTPDTQYQLILYINGVLTSVLAAYNGSVVVPTSTLTDITLPTCLGWKTNGTVSSNWDGFIMTGAGDAVTVDMYNIRSMLVALQMSDSDVFDNMHALFQAQSQMLVDTNDPTGFIDNPNIGIAYNSANRTVTISNPNGIYYYFRGKKYTLGTTFTTTAHDSAVGQYFLYSLDGISFNWYTSVWSSIAVIVAMVTYQAGYKICIRECHGTIPHDVHEDLHNRIGTWLKSGGDLSGYTLHDTVFANRQPTVSNCILRDDDIDTPIAGLPAGTYTVALLSGPGIIVFATSENICAASGVPAYNTYDGANWSTSPTPDGSYTSTWLVALPVASDVDSQIGRYIWIMGEQCSTNIALEEALSPADVRLFDINNLGSEFIFVSHIILYSTGGNWQIAEVLKLGGSKIGQLAMLGSPTRYAVVTDGVTMTGNGLPGFPISAVGGGAYVESTGGTMSGPLMLAADPTQNLQAATKQYVDSAISSPDAMKYKGVIDASTSPNYPAASLGWTYKISVAGKIGGAAGVNVETGDVIICGVETSAAGDQATVGANWNILQANIDGAVIGPTSSSNSSLVSFNGTSGKVIKDSGFMLGNASGNIPVNNGTVNINLNADKLDGNDATAFASAAQGTTADAALPKAGGTMTGAIVLPGNPTLALHAATKQYVDSVAKISNISSQTSSYTFVLADAFTRITMSSVGSTSFTIPTNAAVPFAIGTEIELVSINSGAVSVAATSGVSLESYQSKVTIAGQYAAATVIKTATDTWLLVGALV